MAGTRRHARATLVEPASQKRETFNRVPFGQFARRDDDDVRSFARIDLYDLCFLPFSGNDGFTIRTIAFKFRSRTETATDVLATDFALLTKN